MGVLMKAWSLFLTAGGVTAGGLTGGRTLSGCPWWAIVLLALAVVFLGWIVAVLQAFMPQESDDRRQILLELIRGRRRPGRARRLRVPLWDLGGLSRTWVVGSSTTRCRRTARTTRSG
jgi:hypothetical protein